ncbi:MAG: DUF1080 domain-containing protein [Bryobacterales bacterium]|nr:DUF1080 domain-containing protein [Bryobacterales bacterium]
MRLLAIPAAFACMSFPAPASGVPVPPTGKRIRLFNGKNFDGFDKFLRTKGVNNDPDNVFRVENGVIHVSGSEYGYIITKEEYENYYLRTEFKWGEATYEPRAGKARDSGILLHVTGPNLVWPKSIEFQMIEGGTGDMLMVGGAAMTVKGERKNSGRSNRFNKGPWQDVAGYRDPVNELEKPHGQWNLLELIADGDTVKYIVNGRLANEGSGSTPAKGKLVFQSEGAEVYFRGMELRLLKK